MRFYAPRCHGCGRDLISGEKCPRCVPLAESPGRLDPACELSDVAHELGVTVERARQIERRALEKVRRAFKRLGVSSPADYRMDEPIPYRRSRKLR